MYWILAAIFLLITLAVPRLRPVAFVGVVILAALLAWAMVQRMRSPDSDSPLPQRGEPTSPAAPQRAIPLDSVAMENLQLSGGGAPFELSGRIVNAARDSRLKAVTIRITRRDCYEGALDPTGCVVLWQDRHWLPLSVPPEQSREFAVSIWMRGSAPRPRGTVQDSFELVVATGETVVQSEEPDA